MVYVGEMIFSPQVLDLMKKGYEFLHSIKVLKSGDIPQGAINEGPVTEAMKEMGVKAPVAVIKGLPASAYTGE